jgi:glycosyltransferase involved in cell wall biosynthesis
MVLPTEYEGFGLPYLEAAVSRVPVITFETEAALEILGKKGALFAPINDFKKIVINTLSVINGNNEEMLNEAQARAKEFTWNETARLTLEGYKKALLKMNEQLNA